MAKVGKKKNSAHLRPVASLSSLQLQQTASRCSPVGSECWPSRRSKTKQKQTNTESHAEVHRCRPQSTWQGMRYCKELGRHSLVGWPASGSSLTPVGLRAWRRGWAEPEPSGLSGLWPLQQGRLSREEAVSAPASWSRQKERGQKSQSDEASAPHTLQSCHGHSQRPAHRRNSQHRGNQRFLLMILNKNGDFHSGYFYIPCLTVFKCKEIQEKCIKFHQKYHKTLCYSDSGYSIHIHMKGVFFSTFPS